MSPNLPDAVCGCHGFSVRPGRVMVAALILCGLAAIMAATSCFVLLAKPEFGIGPFAKIEGGELAESFRGIRRMAFLTFGMGMATALTGVIWRLRSKPMACGK
ncbi:MAG: hypothetical protein V4689_13620 [Verrucomicrobiota bacterium]